MNRVIQGVKHKVSSYIYIYRARAHSYIRVNRNLRLTGIISASLLALFVIFATFPIINSLSSAEAATSVASTTTLNMTLGYTSANLDLVVRDSSGTFASSADDQLAKFGITTTNHAGYTLTIEGSDNNGQLSNSSAGTNLSSISSTVDSNSFNVSTSFNGKWGYKPSKYNSALNAGNFYPAPTTVASTLDKTTASNNEAVNYSIGLGARVDYGTPTGTYTNTYILAAVANATPYTISFLDNTSDTSVTNLPPYLTGETNSTYVTIPSTIPLRTGYTFSGWCESAPTINADGSTTCSTSTIAANTDYDFINQTTNSNNVNLYTTWTINHYDLTIDFVTGGVSSVKVCTTSGNCSGNNLIGTISNSGDSVSNLPFNSTYYLYLTLDSATYELDTWTNVNGTGTLSCVATDTCMSDMNPSFTIGDGDAYLRIRTETSSASPLQNLDDALCTSTPSQAYDTRDGQVYTIQRLDDGNCWMMDNLNLGATTLTQDLTSSNTNLDTTVTASTFNGWKKTSGGESLTSAEYISLSGTDSVSDAPYGTLYNYCATSAGTICTDTNSSNATYDICPKGWRLPTGSSSGEFANLYNQPAYNSWEKMRLSAADGGAAFAYAGRFLSGAPVAQGTYGCWWASENGGSNRMYRFTVEDPNSVTPSDTITRTFGMSIRCIKNTTMQGVSQDAVNRMAEGSTISLTDKRDNQIYTAAKINGNLWMTRNLAIGCNGSGTSYGSAVSSKVLAPSTSNVSSAWSTPTTAISAADSTPRMQCNATYGAWYNYSAATANTNTGDGNTDPAVYDICPKGWRLATQIEANGILSYGTNFKLVTGGVVSAGSTVNTNTGIWWLSTPESNNTRYILNNASGTVSIGRTSPTYGLYVRCVFDNHDSRTLSDITTMQQVNQYVAKNTAIGTTATLKDNRDGQTYTVKKLNDGNIWMIDNLNLGATTLTTDLTSMNTNLSTTVTASTFNGWKNSTGTGTTSYTTAEYIPVTASNSATNSDVDPVSNTKYGTLYNYYAASAGTISGSSVSVNASYDICPRGWRLPTGGSSGEFQNLYNQSAYNSYEKMRASIANGGAAFNLAGYRNGTVNPTDQGARGLFWGSNRYDSNRMYALFLWENNSIKVDPGEYTYRFNQMSIRCIVNDQRTIADISNMQDINSTIVNNTPNGATATLKDTRDNQTYTVAKINGNVWMTRNLAIGCNGSSSTYGSSVSSKSLTSSDSNVSSSWSTPTALLSTPANNNTTSGYTTAALQCSSEYGAWYNYAAASAGTITGSSNSSNATYDICPKGWRLPTGSEQSGITSYSSAYFNGGSPVLGGYYGDGTTKAADSTGYWWSSTQGGAGISNGLNYYTANGGNLTTNSYFRYMGYYTRCVAK